MSRELACAGAPRDLGLDQGRACAALLQERFERARGWDRLRWRLGRADPRSARIARELRRHFPHQFEAMEGLARGAGVPPAWLVRELLDCASRVADGCAAVATSRDLGVSGALAAAVLPPGAVVRRSRPEAGFRSLEVTLPWISSALAGVNERGLAVVARGGGFPDGSRAGPAWLLAQDCLQRFDSLEAALDWCARRPSGGRAALLLADARGEVAGVELAGADRRVLRPVGGALIEAGGAGDALARALRAAAPLDPAGVAAVLAAHGGPDGRARVLLDPTAGRLGLLGDRGRDPSAPEIHWAEL